MAHESISFNTVGEGRDGPAELLIVMPVYNEQASVRKVVTEWFTEVENWTERFTLLVINDGSMDETQPILEGLQRKLGNRLEIIARENRGHGQTCLQGYQIACERKCPYVMQIDSDGQCDPQYFFRFWRAREKFDVIYGHRYRREDGLRRVVASQVLRTVLLLFARVWCIDANVPFRLMKTAKLSEQISRIPRGFFLANVALAILLRRENWSQGIIPIRFRERYGGEPSVRISKFGSKAGELIQNIEELSKSS